jgi:hypothetical protein
MFIFPAAIVIALVVGLMYVKPGYERIQEKNQEAEDLRQELAELQDKLRVIEDNYRLIQDNSVAVDTIRTYLPEDHREQIIVQSFIDQGNRSESTWFESSSNVENDPRETRRRRREDNTIDFYQLIVNGLYAGEYPQLRELAYRVEQSERLMITRQFSMVAGDEDEIGGVEAEMILQYNALPRQEVTSLDDFVYGVKELDLSVADEIRARIDGAAGESGLSPIGEPPAGRANPFQP